MDILFALGQTKLKGTVVNRAFKLVNIFQPAIRAWNRFLI